MILHYLMLLSHAKFTIVYYWFLGYYPHIPFFLILPRYPIRGEKQHPAVTPPEKIPHSGRNAAPADIPPEKIPHSGRNAAPADIPPQKIPHSGRKASSSSHSSPKDTLYGDRSNSQALYMTFN